MRDYAELNQTIRELRDNNVIYHFSRDYLRNVMKDAADAIEELLAMACPHYHRNVHDRGDDSYCDVLNAEPPKGVE